MLWGIETCMPGGVRGCRHAGQLSTLCSWGIHGVQHGTITCVQQCAWRVSCPSMESSVESRAAALQIPDTLSHKQHLWGSRPLLAQLGARQGHPQLAGQAHGSVHVSGPATRWSGPQQLSAGYKTAPASEMWVVRSVE